MIATVLPLLEDVDEVHQEAAVEAGKLQESVVEGIPSVMINANHNGGVTLLPSRQSKIPRLEKLMLRCQTPKRIRKESRM